MALPYCDAETAAHGAAPLLVLGLLGLLRWLLSGLTNGGLRTEYAARDSAGAATGGRPECAAHAGLLRTHSGLLARHAAHL